MGEYEKSIRDSKDVTILDPTNPEGFHHLALHYKGVGEYEKAIQAWNEAIRLKPSESEFFYLRGITSLFLDKGPPLAISALRDLNEAIRLDPSFCGYHVDRCVLYYTLNQYEKVIIDTNAFFKKQRNGSRIDDRPDTLTVVYYHRGMAYQYLGETEKADKDFKALSKIDLDRRSIRELDARVVSDLFCFRAEAKRHFRRLIESAKDYSTSIDLEPIAWRKVKSLLLRASCYVELRKFKKAIVDFKKVIEVRRCDDNDVLSHSDFSLEFLYESLINCYLYDNTFNKNNYEEALEAASEAVRVCPYSIITLLGRAQVYNQHGKLKKALVDADKAVRLERRKGNNDLFALQFRSSLYLELEKYEKAVRDCSEGIKKWFKILGSSWERNQPITTSLFKTRAIAYKNLGRFEFALQDALKHAQINKEVVDFSLIEELQRLCSKSKNWQKRKTMKKKIVRECGACGKKQKKMQKCSKCKKKYYCSIECQKGDWKEHKRTECKENRTK